MAASGHCSLVENMLVNPRAVQAALWKFLSSKEALIRGSRVWLRPTLPWQEAACLLETLRIACAAPSSLQCFSGIVTAVSAIEETRVDCTFACSQCGAQERVFGDVGALPMCCGFKMEQDISTLVTVPVCLFYFLFIQIANLSLF